MIVRATAHARFTTVLAAIAAILVVTTQLGCATLFGRDPGVDENGKKIVFTYDD